MASGKTSKAMRSARAAVVVSKPKPWGTIAAVMAIVLFAGGVFGYSYYRWDENRDFERQLTAFTPSEDNNDPSEQLDGIVIENYEGSKHVGAVQRVAYDQSPPFGGPHDQDWADCNGQVYATPVRSENMVHALEHGAVWITYNPDQVKGKDVDLLAERVTGELYTMMSPYPDLDSPISLQSWGHQLKVDKADDIRIDQFIRALRANEYLHPEPGGSCDADPTAFNVDAPPPFVAEPPGEDAVPMDGGGDAADENMNGESTGTETTTGPSTSTTESTESTG